MGVCMCMGVVCIYALMCVGKCVYLYVDDGVLQMFVCEQNTFTAHCMHFFYSHIIQQSDTRIISDNLPLKTTLHLMQMLIFLLLNNSLCNNIDTQLDFD